MKATGILVAFVLLPTITLVPEMAEELCLPRFHPYFPYEGPKYRRGLGRCQDFAASRPLVVASRPSGPGKDYNY